MKKPTLEEIRRSKILDILVTYRYFDKKEKIAHYKDKVPQKEVGRHINWFYIDKEADPLDTKKWPVTPLVISKTLKGLEKDGLIIKDHHKTPGKKGPAENLIILKRDINTLYKIIKEYNNPTFEYHYRGLLGINLLNSPYGYELVNMDLVDTVLKEYKGLLLESKEKKRLLDLIKISPSALFVFIDGPKSEFMKSNLEYLSNEENKKALFLYVLDGVGRDFTYLSPHSTPWKVEYETKVKFSDWETEDKINPEPYLEDTLLIEKNSIKMTSRSTRGGTIFSTYYKPFKE